MAAAARAIRGFREQPARQFRSRRRLRQSDGGAGDLRVDLRGKPAKSYSVNVQAGAGDTTIELPSDVGISARTSGLIGDSSVSGLEKRGDRWVNPRAEGSPVTIDVQVQHAIGDLRIRAD